MPRFPWVFAVLLLAATAHADKRSQALQLADDSEKAYKAGKFEKAADLLKRAHELYPEPILLYNMGRALEGMGDAKDAVDAYEKYLHDAKQIDDRGAIERRIATLKAQLDKEKQDRERIEKERIEKERIAKERIEKEKQQQQPKDEPPPPPKDEPLPPPKDEPLPPKDEPLPARPLPPADTARDNSQYLPWGTIGLGGALVVTGAIYGWRAGVNHDDAVNAMSQRDALALQASAQHDASVANILFVVGGAVAIGGGIWAYFEHEHASSSSASLKLAPNGIAVEWTLR